MALPVVFLPFFCSCSRASCCTTVWSWLVAAEGCGFGDERWRCGDLRENVLRRLGRDPALDVFRA
ncbi:MAG: hypothetical protein ACLUW6_07815 [Coriobacteriaceae bacterium]